MVAWRYIFGDGVQLFFQDNGWQVNVAYQSDKNKIMMTSEYN